MNYSIWFKANAFGLWFYILFFVLHDKNLTFWNDLVCMKKCLRNILPCESFLTGCLIKIWFFYSKLSVNQIKPNFNEIPCGKIHENLPQESDGWKQWELIKSRDHMIKVRTNMIFAGIAVTVGVSMYVLSISRLSEVDMVIPPKPIITKRNPI